MFCVRRNILSEIGKAFREQKLALIFHSRENNGLLQTSCVPDSTKLGPVRSLHKIILYDKLVERLINNRVESNIPGNL